MKNLLPQGNIQKLATMLEAEGLVIMDSAPQQLEKEIGNFAAIVLLDKATDGKFRFDKNGNFKYTLSRKKMAKVLNEFELLVDTFMPENEIDQELMARAIGTRYLITRGECALLPRISTLNLLRLESIMDEGSYDRETFAKVEKISVQAEIWSNIEKRAEKFIMEQLGA